MKDHEPASKISQRAIKGHVKYQEVSDICRMEFCERLFAMDIQAERGAVSSGRIPDVTKAQKNEPTTPSKHTAPCRSPQKMGPNTTWRKIHFTFTETHKHRIQRKRRKLRFKSHVLRAYLREEPSKAVHLDVTWTVKGKASPSTFPASRAFSASTPE